MHRKIRSGIGIKTFLEKNGATMQKIAEFNSEHNLFSGLNAEQKVRKISRIEKYPARNNKTDIRPRKSHLPLRYQKRRRDTCLRNADGFC
jgi:hypothetical protein